MDNFWSSQYDIVSERAYKMAGLIGKLKAVIQIVSIQTDNPDLKRYLEQKLSQCEAEFAEILSQKEKTA